MSTPNNQDPLARLHQELRGHSAHQPRSGVGSHRTPTELHLRLPEDAPAHQALRCHVDLTLGHLPDQSWKRRLGRPNNRWIDQLRRDNNTPPPDLWRRSTTHGHTGVRVDDDSITISEIIDVQPITFALFQWCAKRLLETYDFN